MGRPRVRDDIALMDGYHSPQLEVAVRLNTNEAPEPPPEAFDRELAAAVSSIDWNRYPDRSALELREGIAVLEAGSPARQVGSPKRFGSANVLVANGSNEVLQAVCLAYGGAGRTAVTFEPTYALHSHIARVCGTEVVSGDRDEQFGLDPAVAQELISRARPSVTFLCSPNNPTGRVESPGTVEAVLEMVEAVDGLLVVDEAYGQFAPHSALDLVSDDRSLVVTRTFSKTWSAAALRLGYLLGPTWLVGELEKVLLPYHLDALKQAAGVLALGHLDEMEARVAHLVEERGRVAAGLEELDVTQWPSGANFILLRPRSRPGDEVWQALLERGVLVRNCASWPGLDECLRVTIGTRAENDAFLDALADVLA